MLWGHVFRNSLMSIVTLLGLSLPTLVAGAIFIEVVFNYPGMGLAFYNAALNVDYEVLLGFTRDRHAGDDPGEPAGRRQLRGARPEGEVQLMAMIPPRAESGQRPSRSCRRRSRRAAGRRELARRAKPRSLLRRGWEVFAENKLALASLGLIVFIVLFCFVGPLIYHTNQVNTNLATRRCARRRRPPARLRQRRLRRARPADGRRPDLARGRLRRRRSSRCCSACSTGRSPGSSAGSSTRL